ncbi:hypothetical protein ACTQ45_11330 [Fundicoccus sp. Sow4_D5]
MLEYAFMLTLFAYVVNVICLLRLSQQMGASAFGMGYYVVVAKR